RRLHCHHAARVLHRRAKHSPRRRIGIENCHPPARAFVPEHAADRSHEYLLSGPLIATPVPRSRPPGLEKKSLTGAEVSPFSCEAVCCYSRRERETHFADAWHVTCVSLRD